MKDVKYFINNEKVTHYFWRKHKIKEWDKSKNKNYYKVHMLNGGYKYVYMCEEMVREFYGYQGFKLIG